MADVYPSTTATHAGTGRSPNVDVTATAVITPTDRVRWGPILAGLFAALSALAVLGTLGAAVGLSAYDPGDSARNFGIGSGIWGVISMLLAFGLGGWLAARSAAVRGHDNGLLNGAMVWAVAIPLLAYVAAGLLTQTAEVGTQAVSVIRDDNTSSVAANGQTAGEARTASEVTNPLGQQQIDYGSVNTEVAADRAATSAWTTLVGLLLSLGAAAGGGYMGARGTRDDRDQGNRDYAGGSGTAAT